MWLELDKPIWAGHGESMPESSFTTLLSRTSLLLRGGMLGATFLVASKFSSLTNVNTPNYRTFLRAKSKFLLQSKFFFFILLIVSLCIFWIRYMLTFAEHECYGKGSNTSNRVKWEARLDRKTLTWLTSIGYIDDEGWISRQPFNMLTTTWSLTLSNLSRVHATNLTLTSTNLIQG